MTELRAANGNNVSQRIALLCQSIFNQRRNMKEECYICGCPHYHGACRHWRIIDPNTLPVKVKLGNQLTEEDTKAS
jgi:hypothetical protein